MFIPPAAGAKPLKNCLFSLYLVQMFAGIKFQCVPLHYYMLIVILMPYWQRLSTQALVTKVTPLL